MTAQARPLLWWTQAQLDALAASLAGTWAAWLRDWQGQGGSAGEVECVLAQDAQLSACWAALGEAGSAAAWSERPVRAGDWIRTTLFGAEVTAAPGSLAATVEKKASEALEGELALALGLQRSTTERPPAADDHGLWSGGVLARLSSPAASVRLLLNGACAAKALGNRGAEPSAQALPPVAEGLSRLPVRAAVELAACEIDVGGLQAVKVGDILRLPHLLEEPMHVTVARRRVGAAYLGRRGDFRAVELLPATGR